MVRALVLAAGRGERLRPLSDLVPKPLLPVLGVSILERTLGRLAEADVESAAVNLHHLGEQIRRSLGERVGGMPLSYWPEEELLGTLGPLGRLGEYLEGCEAVLLVNGDSLCRWPVDELVREHHSHDSEVTLLLSARADPAVFGGGVAVDEAGRVLSFRGEGGEAEARRGVFAGFHVISTEVLRGVAPVPSDIVRDLYEPYLAAGGSIRTLFTERPWHDLGTPRRYLVGVLDEASSSVASGPQGVWRGVGAEVGPGARVERAVLERGARVEPGAEVESSLLMAGATIGEGARVKASILGPGVCLDAGSTVESRLVLPGEDGGAPESVPI